MNVDSLACAVSVILIASAQAVSQPDSHDSKALMERGDAWTSGGEWDKAIKDYTEAIRLDPRNVEAFIRRGFAHRAKGTLEEAMKDFDRALRLDPKSARAFLGRGATWATQQKFDEAIADYTETVRLDPKLADGYFQRSYCRQMKGEWAAALEDAEEGVRLAPKLAAAVYARGSARQGKGDWAGALSDYEKAIQLDPQYVGAYSGIALIQSASPDPRFRDGTKALKNARRACELTYWRESSSLEAYAAAAAEKGDFAEAVKWQKKVLDDSIYLKWRGMDLRRRLELYEAKEPYRMPSVEPKCAQ